LTMLDPTRPDRNAMRWRSADEIEQWLPEGTWFLLPLVAIAWVYGLLGSDEDLKHCTASLTRGVVKFAQAEGVLKWQNIKRGMLENPPVNESQCYTQT
jgi:hypothetical protein